MPSVIMTLIGKDRPGLVESLAKIVTNHDANWLDSRMSHLGGQFAGILQLDVEADRIDALVAALNQLDSEGLSVIVQTDSNSRTIPANPQTQMSVVEMELLGNDRPGIIREVSHVLADLGINVEEIQTGVESAPMSGGNLFRARARLRLPPGLTTDALRQPLEQIAGDLMVDIQVHDAAPR